MRAAIVTAAAVLMLLFTGDRPLPWEPRDSCSPPAGYIGCV